MEGYSPESPDKKAGRPSQARPHTRARAGHGVDRTTDADYRGGGFAVGCAAGGDENGPSGAAVYAILAVAPWASPERMAVMAAYYLFFRCWPGFTEQFPIDRFNALSDDELPKALDDFAREQLRSRKEEIRDIRRKRKRDLYIALRRQAKRVLHGHPSGRSEKLTRRWFWDRIRRASRYGNPLVCRVGGYLGWWRGRKCHFGDRAAGPRVWFWETPDPDFAEYLVTRLNGQRSLTHHDYEAVEVEYELNVHFGWVAAEGLGREERAPIRRQIDAIRDGKEPPTWDRKLALAMGQRAREFAEEEAEAWVDPAPEQDEPQQERHPDSAPQGVMARAPVGDQGEGDGAGPSPKKPGAREPTRPGRLKPSQAKAYGQWKRAIELNAELDGASDRTVYDWVAENMLDEGEKPPAFGTWARQLRAGRSFHGNQKNEPRVSRPHGKSIVRKRQI